MTRDQIDSFLTTVECGNFANAAASLFITQSTLGYRVSNLEKELGYSLFMRSRGQRRVELTVEGAKFVPIAREMKRLWSDALAAKDAEQRQTVRISFNYSLQSPLINSVLPLLAVAGYDASVVSTTTRDALESLKSGGLDFAIVGDSLSIDEDLCMVEPLAREHFCVLSNPELGLGREVCVSDLDPKGEVYTKWSEACENWHYRVFGESFSPSMTLMGVLQVYEILSDRPDGWTLVPSGIATYYDRRGLLRLSYLDEEPPTRQVRLLSKRPILTDCHNVLLMALRDCMSGTSGFDPIV